LAANGTLSVVASSITPAPGGAGQFNGFADVTIDGGRIAFRGDTSSGEQGIYTADGAAISVIAQRGDAMPGVLDPFTGFGHVSLSQGNLAFYGAAGTNQGIFLEVGNSLSRVVGTGDVLDGRTVASVIFGSEGLSGDKLAFGVTFSDESQAIYLADVGELTTAAPEPASVILFAFGCTSLFAWNGWRKYIRTT
jgi:hypothetical protein